MDVGNTIAALHAAESHFKTLQIFQKYKLHIWTK